MKTQQWSTCDNARNSHGRFTAVLTGWSSTNYSGLIASTEILHCTSHIQYTEYVHLAVFLFKTWIVAFKMLRLNRLVCAGVKQLGRKNYAAAAAAVPSPVTKPDIQCDKVSHSTFFSTSLVLKINNSFWRHGMWLMVSWYDLEYCVSMVWWV